MFSCANFVSNICLNCALALHQWNQQIIQPFNCEHHASKSILGHLPWTILKDFASFSFFICRWIWWQLGNKKIYLSSKTFKNKWLHEKTLKYYKRMFNRFLSIKAWRKTQTSLVIMGFLSTRLTEMSAAHFEIILMSCE